MPKLSQVFPSRYLKADDAEEGDLALTIKAVRQERVGSGPESELKWALAFRETDKLLILNKVNSNSIAKLYGDDTDHWIGNQIVVYATETSFQGDQVPCLRVRTKPLPKPTWTTRGATQPPVSQEDDEDRAF